MADKPNLSQQAAEDTVFSNLGLSREDLGMDPTEGSGWDDGSGQDEGHDEGSGQGGEQLETGLEDHGDDESRVSHTRIPESAEVKPDKRGNLVGKDGKVIARAGKEARLYQDLHRSRGQAQTLQGQVNDLSQRLRKAVEIGQRFHTELQAARSNNGAIKQFGLNESEHLSALRLFKELRDNPQQALKNILTRAAANGINVVELGGASGGIDAKALVDLVRQEIGQAMNPLKERSEAERRAGEESRRIEARRTEIQNEVDSFFVSNPEAQPYLPVFTQTIRQFPNMTLGEIWARIQLQLERNPQPRRTQQNSSRRGSIPSGRSAPSSGSDEMAPVNESYESIVRAALDASGIGR